MSKGKVTPGTLLIAAPTLRDPNFARTVVLMIAHGLEGSFGLVLNRPTEVDAAALVPGAQGFVHCGGPVQLEEVMFLHRLGAEVLGAQEVMRGVFFGGNLADLKLAIEGSPAGANHWRVFLGYSGWGERQLQDELEAGGWIVCPGRPEYVFDVPPEELWGRVLTDLGDQYRYMTSMPLDPRMN